MRITAAAILSLIMLPPSAVFAADTPTKPAATAPAAAAPAATTPAASAASSDAAATRHAKRTACRKEANDQHLTGAKKTAYVKDCLSK